jgi:hypothetical protein
MQWLGTAFATLVLGGTAVCAAELLHPPRTVAELQSALKPQTPSRGELRLQATGQLRDLTNTSPLRKYTAQPKANPALRALYSREGKFYEGGNTLWLLIPDQLFVHYRSDVTVGTLLRAQVLAVANAPGEQAVLLLEGYEVTGQAAAPGAPKRRISESSSK